MMWIGSLRYVVVWVVCLFYYVVVVNYWDFVEGVVRMNVYEIFNVIYFVM